MALGIQHTKRMRHIVIGGMPAPTIVYHIITKRARFSGKALLNPKCVFCFSLRILSENFLILTRIKRDIIINVYTSSCKVPVMVLTF